MAMDEGKTWISRLILLLTALINRVKRNRKSVAKVVSYIPGDIVTEIMLRVPLETLIACKKEWNLIPHHPRLMKRYSTRMALFFPNGNSLCCIHLHSSNGPYPRLKWEMHPVDRESSTVHLVESDWTWLYDRHLLHWDRSNGVACCRGMNLDSRFLVYFMLTNTYTEVSAAPCFRGYWPLYGFGYDDVARDHKIMTASKENKGLFWVYSLQESRWKQHLGFPYASYEMIPKYRHRDGCALDGVPLLHWLVLTVGGGEDRRIVILTYHLNSGRFGEIALPPAVENDIDLLSETSMRLFELDGCLCCGYEYDGTFDTFLVWAMKEYGVVESWTKLFSINHRNVRLTFFDADPIVVYERGDGSKAVLFKRQYPLSSVLFWYDINSGEVKEIKTIAWWCRD